MTERELRKLSRTDLLELLLAQRRENEQLRCILDQTQAQLADRTIKIDKAGSIADSSLQLSGIFNAAQDSCKYYMDNIKLLSERQSALCQQMEQETTERCRKMEQETKVKCDQMVTEAELKSQQCWDNCSIKVKELISSFEGLQQVLELYASFQPIKSKPTGNITGEIY